MATYLALNKMLWRQARIHLCAVARWDTGLRFDPPQPANKKLFGYAVKEICYAPTNLQDEGRKLLDSVINCIKFSRDVLLVPLEDSHKYDDPKDLSILQQQLPQLNYSLGYIYLSQVAGFTTERVEPNTHDKLWVVEYDAGTTPQYLCHSMIEGSNLIPMPRPEILFHELVHVETVGDPLQKFPAGGGPIAYAVTEALAISRTNAYRLSRNPNLTAADLRNPGDNRIEMSY